MIEIADTEDDVILDPFFLRVGQLWTDDVVFDLEGIDEIRLLRHHPLLRFRQLGKEIRTGGAHAKVIVRRAERVKERGVFLIAAAVAFRHHGVDPVPFEGVQQALMVWEDGNLGGNPVLVEKFSQHLHDGAVQSADPHPVQRVIRRGDSVVLTVFDHVVGFAAHRELRVADDADSAFRLREPCQEIDLTVQEHLVKIGESAVDILVLPACVFGNLR